MPVQIVVEQITAGEKPHIVKPPRKLPNEGAFAGLKGYSCIAMGRRNCRCCGSRIGESGLRKQGDELAESLILWKNCVSGGTKITRTTCVRSCPPPSNVPSTS